MIDVNCNVSKTNIYKDDLQEKCLHFQAGQVRNYSQHWELLTNDPVILDARKHYHIEFELDDPIQNKEPHNIRCSSNDRNIISTKIFKLLSKRVLELTLRSPGDFISNIFIRPKKDGSYRMILNLKPLNEFVDYHHFKITVKLPPSKAAKVKSACQNLVLNCNPIIREVAQVIGLIVSNLPAVQYAQLHYRTLESEKIHALKVNAENYEFTMTLSQMAKTELTWWIENIDMASRPIMFGNPEITITTDASNLGWGAVCNGTKTGGPWGKDEADFHINYLEMKAVLLGLKSLCNNTTGKHIRVQSDNTTTVSYINEMGGIKSVLCNDMAQTIWAWCIDSNIWLIACHIPGSQNTDADKQSRVFNVSTEWSLSTQVFEDIQKLWGKSDVDLFASRLNFKIPSYVSCRLDPNAMFVNALYMNWHDYSFYVRTEKHFKPSYRYHHPILDFWNPETISTTQGPHSHILMTGGSEGFFWV